MSNNAKTCLLGVFLGFFPGFLLAGCDRPPSEGTSGTSSESTAAQAPPDGFRTLMLGEAFVRTSWGPDITAEQYTTFGTLSAAGGVAEVSRRADVARSWVDLEAALNVGASEGELRGIAENIARTERLLVELQIDNVVQLLGVFSAEQVKDRLRMGYPAVLGEAISSHPLITASNPFASAETSLFRDEDLQAMLSKKLEIHKSFLEYQRATAPAISELATLDMTAADWPDRYRTIIRPALDGWTTFRGDAILAFSSVIAGLPDAPRRKFILSDGVSKALSPPDRSTTTPSSNGAGSASEEAFGEAQRAFSEVGADGQRPGASGGPPSGGPGSGGPGSGGPGSGGPPPAGGGREGSGPRGDGRTRPSN